MAMAPFIAPMLMGGLGLAGGMMQMNAQRQAQRRMSQMQDVQMGMVGEARQALTGKLSAGQQSELARQREAIRANQASRGIFESGVGAAQESELMPILEQQLRQQQMQAMLQLSEGMGGPLQSQAGMMGGFGQGIQGSGQLFGQGLGMLPGAFNQFNQQNPLMQAGMGAGRVY